jgi:isoaspartyl peptidase/L-asparaginase-like protein (Ntn-hydrolase superfamily)
VGHGNFADNYSGAISGTGTGEYFMRAGVARRIARRLEEDIVSPQVGRKHVKYRDQGVLHAGRSSPEDCQEAGGRYRLPTGGQKACQV